MHKMVVLALTLLAGCGDSSADAMNAVKTRMMYPSSAQFREVEPCPANQRLFTGEVSGAKANGQRTAFQVFIVSGQNVVLEGDQDFRSYVIGCHGNEFMNELDDISDQLNDNFSR